MDMQLEQLVQSFKEEFKETECQEFYRIDQEVIEAKINAFNYFIEKMENDEVQIDDLKRLLEFIQNDDVLEIFMNEFITPYAPGKMVASTLEGEFVGSIGVYDRFTGEKDKQVGAIMIAPILVVCSIIQNGYLFIQDIDCEDMEYYLENSKAISNSGIDYEKMYSHIINLVVKPFIEVVEFRLQAPKRNVPQYIITSFGLIGAKQSLAYGNDIIKQIEDALGKVVNDVVPIDEIIN